MGAQPFVTHASGEDAKSAFWTAVDAALFEYGHSGYSGSIAEKDSFVAIELPKGVNPEKEACRLINECDPRIDDKWGPAGMFNLSEGQFLFFGWASY